MNVRAQKDSSTRKEKIVIEKLTFHYIVLDSREQQLDKAHILGIGPGVPVSAHASGAVIHVPLRRRQKLPFW